MEEANICLEKKNIKTCFNFNDKNLMKYICFGFLFKKNDASIVKNHKRFFFLISSRPLSNSDYKKDYINLERSALPCWAEFNTLYYYEFENANDDSKIKGEISLW